MERSLLGAPASYEGGLHEIGKGALAWLQPNGDWGESNAAVVVGEGEAVLVDTLWTPALTRRMLSDVAARVAVPIRTVINTHSDGDHVWGNQVVAEAEIISSRVATRIMREEGPRPLRAMRITSSLLRRVPGAGTFGSYMSWMLSPYDFSEVTVRPAQREFERELELSPGGRELRLHEVGPAHTEGDLIVHVPDAGVVLAGDIMFAGVHPVMWAGPSSNWIAALDLILRLEPQTVLPGHGPVCGPAEVRVLRDYFEWLEQAAAAGLERGQGARAVALELARSDEFRGSPWAKWVGPERLVISIATIDRHRRHGGGAVSGAERAWLFSQVAALARELRGAPS